QHMHEYADAEKVFERAVSLVPDSIRSKLGLAQVALYWKGDTAPAKALIARYPGTHSDPRGQLTADSGFMNLFKVLPAETAAAIAPLPIAATRSQFEIYPKPIIDGLAAEARGDTAAARDRYEAARAFLEAGVKENPNEHQWRTSLGLAYALLGRKE